eukprot:CAMPEP_0202456258 /NCGR_PEP_ID=MMETSP1360-20130828/13565_1 /ASSEMBLY_ACC=CAM_ASM_000848 /TAXON_ID=515479 /ORGANISM="Licmophora paradoxa, Strain CCMP2313" /LENGTH=89 /DNA_ID=CAMNT_0049076013 /DNA_START=565 /DNA_END=834 /DNA_ORIENTATION=+
MTWGCQTVWTTIQGVGKGCTTTTPNEEALPKLAFNSGLSSMMDTEHRSTFACNKRFWRKEDKGGDRRGAADCMFVTSRVVCVGSAAVGI